MFTSFLIHIFSVYVRTDRQTNTETDAAKNTSSVGHLYGCHAGKDVRKMTQNT